MGILSVVLAAVTLPYWEKVYANDVRHVDEAYVKMGEWINENTPPDARIAAFDIGILRYVGDRYTIDLGGLTSPDVHPYLEINETGEYIRLKDANYILYSRNPDTEAITRIFFAEYKGPLLLKQRPVIHFDAPQYGAPTLIHSYRTALNEILGWYPMTLEGRIQAFSYDNREFHPIGEWWTTGSSLSDIPSTRGTSKRFVGTRSS